MRKSPPQTVLITGAATGLGLELARVLIAQRVLGRPRFCVFATARPHTLERFAAAGIEESEFVHLRPLDVVVPQQRQAVVDEIENDFGGLDVLVNNAGVAYRSVVEDVSDNERFAQMNINFLAPMALARQVLPGMRARQRGRIINVSSVGGMMAMPTMSVYSASKFALEGASEALWYEVRPWNIHVTLVQPGFIASESFQNTRYTAASGAALRNHAAPYHAHYSNMAPFIARLMHLSPSTANSVAKTILRTILARRPALRVPATIDAHLFALLRRWLPRWLYHELLYRALPGVRHWGPALAHDSQELSPAELSSPDLATEKIAAVEFVEREDSNGEASLGSRSEAFD
jgi:short-subunit dehydrogenase